MTTIRRRGSRNPRAEVPAESFDDEGVRLAILAALEAVYECFPHITLPQYLITLEVRKAERDGNPHTLASIVKKLKMPFSTASRVVWSLTEEGGDKPVGPRKPAKGRLFKLEPLTGEAKDAPRLASGVAELDRVTGGGFVRGSVILMAGDPGIGKSTLLIQASAALARAGHRAVYISGEEAAAQVRLRAERLGLSDAPVELASETSVEDIIATLSEGKVPRLIIIDSIQTMWTDAVESAPGTVTLS